MTESIENANDRFERLAEQFYQETGYIAPGKDVPPGLSSHSYETERRLAWAQWQSLPPDGAPGRTGQ
jgi:hypothetical protein